MGGYPPYGTVPGGFPGTGCAATERADTTAAVRREVGVHIVESGEGGGEVSDDGGVYLLKTENSCAVHCYAIAYGTL